MMQNFACMEKPLNVIQWLFSFSRYRKFIGSHASPVLAIKMPEAVDL